MSEETVTIPKAELDELTERLEEAIKRCQELEKSAHGAREIARAAMTHTSTRTMRVELVAHDQGLTVIVCDPAGDEEATTRRMAKMLDTGLWALVGVKPEIDHVRKYGSTI